MPGRKSSGHLYQGSPVPPGTGFRSEHLQLATFHQGGKKKKFKPREDKEPEASNKAPAVLYARMMLVILYACQGS